MTAKSLLQFGTQLPMDPWFRIVCPIPNNCGYFGHAAMEEVGGQIQVENQVDACVGQGCGKDCE